jgi:hypothetical protein
MKTSLKLKQPSRNWTETSEKSSSLNPENSSTQSITKEDKREWPKEFKEDGTALTLFSLANLAKNNKDTEITSKPICKTTEKMKESKNSWTDKNFWVITNTVSTSTISNKATQFHRKTTKPLTLRRRSSSSSTEEPWTPEPTTKEETSE